MPRTGRPKVELTLSDEERDQLARWSRRANSSQALALRSRIVLACAEGLDNKVVAARLGCAAVTVGRWRGRFVQDRLDGLVDEPRPGRPPVISVDRIEDVVVATLAGLVVAQRQRGHAGVRVVGLGNDQLELAVAVRDHAQSQLRRMRRTGAGRRWPS